MIQDNKEPLQLMSLNTNGLRDGNKRRSLFNWLKQFHNGRSKVIFLQETHTDKKIEAIWERDWGGKILFSHGTSGSKGVAILLPTSIEYKVENTIEDPNGRFIATQISLSSSVFWLCNCYAPCANKPHDQLAWLEQIQNILDLNSDKNIIIGGDLNDVFIPHLDKYKCPPNTPETEYVKAWKTLCNDIDLSDAWRLLNPTTRQYTWRQGGSAKTLKQSRLDYWLTSNHLLYELRETIIEAGFRSDHSLISISYFKKETSERGPSYWRFNASLLKDREYIDYIKEKINNFKIKYQDEPNHSLTWDLIKMEIRSSTICFSKNKSTKNRNNLNETIQKLTTLEKSMAAMPTDIQMEQIHAYKSEIEAYNNEKSAGILIRSKADWTELGEKNTRYFLNLEKRNYNNKCITKLIKDNKEEITEKEEILTYEHNFYKKLYSNPNDCNEAEREELFKLFNDETILKISQANNELCEQEISIEEIGKALKELKNGKSPGTDGFTPDFYKFFWSDIKYHVFNSILYATQNNMLSIEQRRGIINLIPKKNKDIRFLKNWRPISLLNTDYKIITKLLATRIKSVLPEVINEDQVAYLKGRYIGQNIRLIFDIMEYTKDNKIPGILTFLDFEKAFDTINWEVIQDALTTFGLGENFKSWVKIIYNNTEACVTNNGYSSNFFKLERGVRQGCPLSAYLFIMVVELLSHQIRKNNLIKGIKIGNHETKIAQMADDTTIFVEDIDSLEIVLLTTTKFQKYAGLKLNTTKTEAMWLGSLKNSQNTPLGLKWVKETSSLGIFFSYNTDYIKQKNFTDKSKAFKQLLDMWSQRDLSLLGKITILKSLAFSMVIYQCSILNCPESFLDCINKHAFDFLWNYKPDKIKRTAIIADYADGGLKMLDIYSFVSAQKAMWAKRLMQSDNASWRAYPKLLYEKIAGKYTFNCSLEVKTNTLNLPNFYWQVLKSWIQIRDLNKPLENALDIRREIIWNNKNIKLRKQPINWPMWKKHNIWTIHDITHENGTFLTGNELNQKYGIKCDILKYNALKNVIPPDWRRKLKTLIIPREATNVQEICTININKTCTPLHMITNKHLYWTLIKEKQTTPIIQLKWEEELGIEESEWTQVFTMSNIIKDTKIKTFQYKILYNLIPCKLYLFRIKKSNTYICDTCNEIDNITHFLYNCKDTFKFWKTFERWWNDMMNESVKVDKKLVIIGDIANQNDKLNACLLIAKWFLYSEKLNESSPFFYKFLCHLKYKLVIEKIIYIRNNKYNKYLKLWEHIEDYIT